MSDRTYRIVYQPHIKDPESEQKRWSVPENLMERVQCDKTKRLSFGDFNVDDSPFGFTLKNPAHKNTFWLSTKDRNLVLSDKYLECGFEVHSQQIFGWGERTRTFMLDFGEYSIWPSEGGKGVDPGSKGHNTFGDHPFILARLEDKTYLGLFFKNSNAKVLKYIQEPKGKSVINFKTIGGIIDIFAFMGDTADEVLREYHKVIGEPYMPPLWALGYQQGNAAYNNDTIAQIAVDKFRDNDIPLEALWLDESFQHQYRPFDVDPTRFGNIKTLQSNLAKNHQWLGLSMHPCVPVYDAQGNIYLPFSDGREAGVFVKSSKNTTSFDDILIGEHLPGKCAYLDFMNYDTNGFYSERMNKLAKATGLNAIQLNYNEITQFCDGECPGEDPIENSNGEYENLPYNPIGDSDSPNLKENTLSMDAKVASYDDLEKDSRVEYNVHSIYGTIQSQTVHYYMKYNSDYPHPNQRPLVLSRSTYAGAGQYTGHWIGDNKSGFDDMRYSVAAIMNFQLFGIPLTGANICGSDAEVNPEVCARWIQLGTFYPYARSYFNGTFGSKEAWALKGDYQKAARNAIKLRLSFLRYYYTIFFEMYRHGGSFWRPLFFEFPKDDEAMNDIEHTFMVGSMLKVTPVMKFLNEENKVKSYFPANTRFINLIDWKTIIDGGDKGQNVDLEPNWDRPLVHLREGSILPYQPYDSANSTYELTQKDTIDLVIFPDENLNAEGTIYVDTDGLSEDTFEHQVYQYYKVTYNDRKLRFVLMEGNDSGGMYDMNQIISNITFLDAGLYNDTDFACIFNENMEPSPLNFDYDSDKQLLRLSATSDTQVIELRTMKNIMFGNSKTDQNFCNVTYSVSSVQKVEQGPNAGKSMYVQVEAATQGMNSFNVNFTLIKDNLINVDFIPEIEGDVFEIPDIVLNKDVYPIHKIYAEGDISSYVTVAQPQEEFYFEIHTKDDPKDVLYSTKDQPLIYTEFYKSMGARIYTNNRIFGLGERIGDFWLGFGTHTVWNYAGEQTEDNGEPPGKNLYGSHPVYFAQRDSGTEFFGVYDHNTGPQDFVFEHNYYGNEINTIKTSGKTNLFFMMNDRIDKVIENFYDLVGKPHLPPEWAFGWHQSRFGYNSTDVLREVYEGYHNMNMPLDAIWSDVDYLDNFKDFDVDDVNYAGLLEFVDEIKGKGTRYVPIIGAGISAGDSDAYFDGMEAGVFVKSYNDRSEPFIGRSTPGDCVFVDFFMHNSKEYWHNQLDKLFDKVHFDGVWLDMNEITNYCDGYCYLDQKVKNPVDNKLFYWPGGRDLEKGTISLDAVHENGARELDTHSAYGLLQSYITSLWFNEKDERPFIQSRSTFSGSGKYSGHWTGDNKSDMEWIKYSISSILNFNFFGVPFTGADICGFQGDTDASICSKWYKTAVIYPFARNHNDLNARSQEPYNNTMFNKTIDYTYNMTAQEIMRKAMLVRYGLHVYTYTQYHKAATKGMPVVRPLFYNYPEDSLAYNYIDYDVMVGDSIKASLDYGYGKWHNYYFPERDALWCPIWEESKKLQCFPGVSKQTIDVQASEILIHMKSGSIIPIQLSDSRQFDNLTDVHSLEDLKNKPTDLALMIGPDNKAKGDIRFDDGKTTNLEQYDEILIDAIAEEPWLRTPRMDVNFNVTKQENTAPETMSQQLGEFIIYNANGKNFLNKTTATMTMNDGSTVTLKPAYDEARNVNRLYHDGSKALFFRDIKTIHFEANQ